MCQDGYGRWVPCWQLRRGPQQGYGGGYGGGYGYGGQRSYQSPRNQHCAVVYNQCYPYGRGSGAYTQCMRSQGC